MVVVSDPKGAPVTGLEKAYAAVQGAIYKITEGNGLSAYDVEQLKATLKPFK
jgi:hypothetical protein